MKHEFLPGFAAAAYCNLWDGVLQQAAAAAAGSLCTGWMYLG
jgi:hypothetical protein